MKASEVFELVRLRDGQVREESGVYWHECEVEYKHYVSFGLTRRKDGFDQEKEAEAVLKRAADGASPKLPCSEYREVDVDVDGLRLRVGVAVREPMSAPKFLALEWLPGDGSWHGALIVLDARLVSWVAEESK